MFRRTQCTNVTNLKFNFQLYNTVIYYDYSNNQSHPPSNHSLLCIYDTQHTHDYMLWYGYSIIISLYAEPYLP
jgi:hypothetical protein